MSVLEQVLYAEPTLVGMTGATLLHGNHSTRLSRPLPRTILASSQPSLSRATLYLFAPSFSVAFLSRQL